MPTRGIPIWRSLFACALFLLLVAGSYQPFYLHLLTPQRREVRRSVLASVDRGTERYPSFLREVRSRTSRGDSIAIVVPMRRWDGGYVYAYYRGSYFLAGRRVVPLVDPDDTLHLERLAGVDWVASWHQDFDLGGFVTVWQGDGGTLARRRR